MKENETRQQQSVGQVYDPFARRTGHTLRWQNMAVKKGDKVIIDKISGVSRAGHLTAVMGPSGAGKTTLLRVLGGRGKHEGKVFFDDELIDSGSYKFMHNIAFVSDNDALEPFATCFEVIRFSARLRLPTSFSDESVEKITREVISELKLEKCADNLCKWLSAGEKRRTTLAIEIVVCPGVAILDEPTSGLDR